MTPFIIGVNRLPDVDIPEPKQAIANGEKQASQRSFERGIREAKYKLEAAKQLGDDKLIQRYQSLLSNRRLGLRKLIENNDFLHRDYSRERIYKNRKLVDVYKTKLSTKSKNNVPKWQSKSIGLINKNQDDYFSKVTPELINKTIDEVANTKFVGKQSKYNNSYQQAMYNEAKKQGYDGKPTVLTEEQAKNIPESKRMYRAFDGYDEFVNGELRYSGKAGSLNGRGIYFGNDKQATIDKYLGHDSGKILMTATISEKAVIVDYAKFANAVLNNLKKSGNDYRINMSFGKALFDKIAIELGISGWYYEPKGYIIMVDRTKIGVISNEIGRT